MSAGTYRRRAPPTQRTLRRPMAIAQRLVIQRGEMCVNKRLYKYKPNTCEQFALGHTRYVAINATRL